MICNLLSRNDISYVILKCIRCFVIEDNLDVVCVLECYTLCCNTVLTESNDAIDECISCHTCRTLWTGWTLWTFWSLTTLLTLWTLRAESLTKWLPLSILAVFYIPVCCVNISCCISIRVNLELRSDSILTIVTNSLNVCNLAIDYPIALLID